MIEQTYNLNLVPNSAITMIRCSQYDSDSRTLKFNLYNGAVAYNVPSLCTVTIRGTKKDGTGFEYPCSFVDNVVSFTLKDQMTLFPGDLMCELRIAHGTQVLGSANFLLVIEKSPLNANTAISESEYPIYEELVRRAEEAAAQSDGVKKVNNTLPDGNGNVELQTLPSGGTAGQTIIKQSSTEGDAIWADLNATGIELTQAEYDALSEAEKNNGSLYFITDGESAPSANRIPASGVTYGTGSVADALDSLNGRIPSVEKIIGIATNATTTQIHIQYPSTAGIVLFYFDIGRRVAILNKTSGNSMQYDALNGTFNNTSFSTTDAYLTVGNWCRATLIITSTSLSEITVETV